MRVSILGKQRVGKKSFELDSDDEFGFNIECIDGGGVIQFNNIQHIEWLNCGEHVFLDPPPLNRHLDFTRHDKINIRKAKKIEPTDFKSRLG